METDAKADSYNLLNDTPVISKSMQRKPLRLIAFAIVALIAIVAIILCIIFLTKTGNNGHHGSTSTNSVTSLYTTQDAANAINSIVNQVSDNLTHLYEDSDSVADYLSNNYSLTADENNTLLAAFNAFDSNNDGGWNISEFEDFLLEMGSEETTFNNMDIDSDGVLSFREVVLTLKNQEGVSSGARYVYDNLLRPSVANIYNVSRYVNNHTGATGSNISDVWYEYAADLMLSNYDPGYKGFVTFEDYFSQELSSKFDRLDSNNDSLISFREFINSTFNINRLKYATIHGILTVDSTNDQKLGDNFVGSFGIARNNISQFLLMLHNESISYCPNMNRHGTVSGRGLYKRLSDQNGYGLDNIEQFEQFEQFMEMDRRNLGWLDWYYALACAYNAIECATSLSLTLFTGGASTFISIYYCSATVYDCYEAVS